MKDGNFVPNNFLTIDPKDEDDNTKTDEKNSCMDSIEFN